MIHLLKFLIGLLFLLYACKLDIEARIVPNRIWKYMLAILLPFLIVEFIFYKYTVENLVFAVLQLGMMAALAYVFYLVGAYGGADAKALIVISILFPIYPFYSIFPILNKGVGIFAFSTLTNSVIVAPAILLLVFIKNVTKEGIGNIKNNLLYYFVGYRVEIDSIPKFHNLLEFFDESGKFVRVKRSVEPNEELLRRLKEYGPRKGIKKVWVTPALPFIVFITFGYFLAFVVGDILYFLISLLIRSI